MDVSQAHLTQAVSIFLILLWAMKKFSFKSFFGRHISGLGCIMDLDKALKDPTNLSKAELDEILEAQVKAVRMIKQLMPPDVNEGKTKVKKTKHRSSLKHLNQRI